MKKEEIKYLSRLIEDREKFIKELDFIRKELKKEPPRDWHIIVYVENESIRHQMDCTFWNEDKVIEFCENLAKENIREISKELKKYNIEL